MKRQDLIERTIKTVDGHTIHVIEEEGKPARPHCTTGPAFYYPESENREPEYYINGLKYEKSKWKETVAVSKRIRQSKDYEAL